MNLKASPRDRSICSLYKPARSNLVFELVGLLLDDVPQTFQCFLVQTPGRERPHINSSCLARSRLGWHEDEHTGRRESPLMKVSIWGVKNPMAQEIVSL